MLIVGALMYLLFRTLGHYCVDGVGYATIQAVSAGEISAFWLLGLLRGLQDVGDHDQSGVGLFWRHLFTVVVHRRDAWRRLRGAAERRRPAALGQKIGRWRKRMNHVDVLVTNGGYAQGYPPGLGIVRMRRRWRRRMRRARKVS